MRKLQIGFQCKNFIIVMLDNDFSSKLCFEEKLSISSVCNKSNVIFKYYSCNSTPFAALVAFSEVPCHPFPAEQIERTSFSCKSKNEAKQTFLKSVKVCNITKVSFMK